jgi:parvulin-like peptidyl-prolyl isomerase
MSFISNIKLSGADNNNQKVNTDNIVAIVNNEPIFMSEINSIANLLLNNYNKITSVPVKQNELKNFILNKQVETLLLKQESRKQKIQVTKQEIQNGINEIKKLFKNEQDFNNELKKQNLTINNFTKNIADQISIYKLIKKSLSSKIKIPSEIETKTFYDNFFINFKYQNKNNNNNSDVIAFVNNLRKKFDEHVKIKQIFVLCPKNSTQAHIKAAAIKIANIKGALQKQQSFSSVASQFSEYSKNGNSGLIYKNDLPSHINNIIFHLQVGEYTKEPIKTDGGYHFVKVEEKYAKRDISYDNVKNDIKEFLYKKNFINVYTSYVNSLRNKAYIKINQKW